MSCGPARSPGWGRRWSATRHAPKEFQGNPKLPLLSSSHPRSHHFGNNAPEPSTYPKRRTRLVPTLPPLHSLLLPSRHILQIFRFIPVAGQFAFVVRELVGVGRVGGLRGGFAGGHEGASGWGYGGIGLSRVIAGSRQNSLLRTPTVWGVIQWSSAWHCPPTARL